MRPFNVSIKLSRGYYAVCRGSDWTQRPIATFREWLMAQARGEGVGAAKLTGGADRRAGRAAKLSATRCAARPRSAPR